MNRYQLTGIIKCCVVILFLSAFQIIDKKSVCGDYVRKNGIENYEELTLKENNTYTKVHNSYTTNYKEKGKWELHKDTVTLNIEKIRDLSYHNKIIKMTKDTKTTYKLLVRKDTLFYVNDDNTIHTNSPLIRKN